MVLSDNTKRDIMDVKNFYDQKEQLADLNFFKEVLNILQKEENFRGLYH